MLLSILGFVRSNAKVQKRLIVKLLLNRLKLSQHKFLFLLTIFWVGSRLLLNQRFNFETGLDTDDYLKVANAILSINFSELIILKPIGYPLLLAIAELTPLSLAFIQAILSFISAVQIYFLVQELTLSKKYSVLAFVLYSSYPLTYFFERQGMSETLAACLLIIGFRLVIRMVNDSNTNKSLVLGLVVFSLHLTRPNLSIFFVVFFLFGVALKSNLSLRRARFFIFSGLVLAQLVTFSLEFSFPTSPTYAMQGISEGIVEHMIDTLPASKTHQDLASSIIKSEMDIRSTNPGTRPWAVVHGEILFQETSGKSRASAYRELLSLGIASAIKYPGLYLSSINASFFSIFSGDPNTYLPNSENESRLLRGATLFLSLVIQNPIFLLGGFLPLLLLIFFRKRDIFPPNSLYLPVSIGFLACLLLIAIIYPVDQLRYIFPLIPILIVNGVSLIHYSTSFSLIQNSRNKAG